MSAADGAGKGIMKDEEQQVVITAHGEGGATQRRRPERRQAADFDQRILQVAHRLFAERGVEGVSMHQIAQEAGVGQGTLYRRYAHKGELITDLLAESIRRCLQEIQAVAQDRSAGTALQRLDRVLQKALTFIEGHGSYLAAIMDTSSDARREMKYSSLYYRTVHSSIASLLEEASARPAGTQFTSSPETQSTNPHDERFTSSNEEQNQASPSDEAHLSSQDQPLDTAYTADALLAALDPVLYLFQRHKRGYTAEHILQGLRRIYIDGISFRALHP